MNVRSLYKYIGVHLKKYIVIKISHLNYIQNQLNFYGITSRINALIV